MQIDGWQRFTGEDMTSGKLRNPAFLNLIAACTLILLGRGWAGTELRDCDGRMVRDTTFIESNLASRLDTAAEGTYLDFQMELWEAPWSVPPDSCLRTLGAPCDFRGSYNRDRDSAEAVIWWDWWKMWMPKLIDTYPLFTGIDTTYRLHAYNYRDGAGLYNLNATKRTILALSRECAVMYLSPSQVFVVGGVKAFLPLTPSIHNGIRYNALGQKFERRDENPDAPKVPWRPGITPVFQK